MEEKRERRRKKCLRRERKARRKKVSAMNKLLKALTLGEPTRMHAQPAQIPVAGGRKILSEYKRKATLALTGFEWQ